MSTNHFVVAQRDSAWQYSFKGDIIAPFDTKQAAIKAAIAAAHDSGETDIEVVVHDADLKQETVWRSGAEKGA